MTDKKKPTIQFGDYSKDFLEAFEKETERLIAEQKGEKKQPEPKKLDEQEQKELLESLKQLDEVERNQPKPISENKMNEYLTTLRDIDAKQRNIDSKKPVTEGDLLGGTDNPVTQSQLRQATGELYARIQTSLASVGGGGIGGWQHLVEGTPADGQLPMYDQATNSYVWATVFGVGEAYADSDALAVIFDTVDSSYVQARVSAAVAGGLDSSLILQLINDSYVSQQIGFTAAQSALDSTEIRALLDSGYTTADHDSDTLAQVDSAYVQARVDFTPYGDSDVIELLNGDSGVQNVVPQLDSTYDLGAPNKAFKDLYLSKNTIYMGQNLALSADGALGEGYLYANGDPIFPGGLDSGKIIALIDSAYVQARDSDTVFTEYTTADHDSDTLVQVDSAYIAARLPDLYDTPDHDSDTLVQVDSAYVQKRQIRTLAGLDDTQIDSATLAADDFLQWNGTDWVASPFNIDPGLTFQGAIDATTESAPTGVGGYLYVNTGLGVVGPSFTGIAGDSIDSNQAIAYADSDDQWYILGSINQASVVEVRQGNGISIDDSNPARPFVAINRTETDTWYLDSARTIALIDSAYVNARADHYTTADHDSDTLVLVDSAYVQARQLLDSGGLDSAKVVAIIDSYADSAYISHHWRSLENRFVPVVGPSTQTQGLSIADSFQVNTGEIYFGDVNRVYINETELDSFETESLNDANGFDIGSSRNIRDLDQSGGTYVAVGGEWNTNYRIARSDDFDASSWTYITSISGADAQGTFYGVATDGSGTWVAGGYRSNLVYSTDDGITWQNRATLTGTNIPTGTDYIYEVAHDGTRFLAGGTNGHFITSTDGANWTSISPSGASISGDIKKIMYEPNTGRYLIATTSSIYYTDTSGSHTGPYYEVSGLGGGVVEIFDAVYEPVRGIYSFFGNNGKLWRQNDPNVFTSWTIDTIISGSNVRSVAMNQFNHIIAVGFNGDAQISTDAGVTWKDINTGTTGNLFGVVWDNADKRWVFGAADVLLYKVVVAGSDGLFFNDNRLLTELDSAWVLNIVSADSGGLDSAQVVSIIDSYVDSAFVAIHGYGTADHDSDTLVQVDSAYVAARLPAGSIVAGGRFIANSGFTHDSSDVTPTRFVKNLFGIRDITRDDAGEYTLTFDSATNGALQDSYSYIITTSIDYRLDNPTASTRNVAVLHQDSDKFTLLMERADDGVNQDYGDQDGGARINFTVIKAD